MTNKDDRGRSNLTENDRKLLREAGRGVEAGEDGAPPFGPPPPSGIDQRAEVMYAALRMGATLNEVGRDRGLTRARVQQILEEHGLTSDFRTQRRLHKEAGHRAAARSLEPHIHELRDKGRGAEWIARELELAPDAVREVLRSDPNDRLRGPERRRDLGYLDDELVAMLLEVASALGTAKPTVRQYTSYSEGRRLPDGRPWPTHQTYLKRFYSWTNARKIAGLKEGIHRGPDRGFTYEDCLQYVGNAADFCGRVPTWSDYARYRAVHGGPSRSTVENRFKERGLGWKEFRKEAMTITLGNVRDADGSHPPSSPSETSSDDPVGLSFTSTDSNPEAEPEYSQIQRRRGQHDFRKALLEAYGGACAISGCTVEAVLEAAHVVPWSETRAMDVHRGILLRTDLHTLFDLHLIEIDPTTLRIRVHLDHPEEYAEFDGQRLRDRTPGSPELDVAALKERRRSA